MLLRFYTMHIYYIAFARLPTEKAHGLTIVKSCEAFARAGAEVELIVPRRKTHFIEDIHTTYRVEKNFTARHLPVLDVLRVSSSRPAYWLSYTTFFVSAFFTVLRLPKQDAVLYTREAPLLLLSLLGMPVFLESHHVFGRSRFNFRLARLAKGVVTISHALRQKFIKAGFSEAQVLVQPSGVELATFSLTTPQSDARGQLYLPLDATIVMYTGNFTTMGADKGITDILRALKELPDVTFVAVGGSEKDRVHYEALAAQLGVSSQIELRGFEPQATLALYQRATDILLMPFPDTPHYRSNMSPVKMFEYMASGRPIVASNLPTIAEVLNSANATLVPPGNIQALVEAINGLLSDPERGERLAAQAAKDVQKYSWSERARQVLEFINLTQ